MGHLNENHLRSIYKFKCLIFIMVLYILTLLLTLVNQKTECRMDAARFNSQTGEDLWNPETEFGVVELIPHNLIGDILNPSTQPIGETPEYVVEKEPSISYHLTEWYHIVWSRDVMVLLAWVLVSLSEFQDFLYIHLVNMIKYTDITQENEQGQSGRTSVP